MFENQQNFDNDEGDETVKLQRAYVNGKLGGVKVQAGRYNLKAVDGYVYDNRFDGIQASYGKDVKLTAGYGKATPSSVTKATVNELTSLTDYFAYSMDRQAEEVYYADLSGKVGNLGLNVGYYNFKRDNTVGAGYVGDPFEIVQFGDETKIWTVGANYQFNDDLKLSATYLNGNSYDDVDFDDDGYVVSAQYKGAKASQPGSWGLAATYYDQGASTYIDHTMNGLADSMFGFKGYSVTANYTFAKNIVGQVEWYDLEEKEGAERDADTLWAQLLFTF